MHDASELTGIRIGKELGVDPEAILATSHGRRSIEVLEIYDPKLATWECGWDQCQADISC